MCNCGIDIDITVNLIVKHMVEHYENSLYSQQLQKSPGKAIKPRVVRSQAFEPGTLSTARQFRSKNDLPPRPANRKAGLRVSRKEQFPAQDNELASYQEEIKSNIEKLLEVNKLPKLELRKNLNEYTVSLEDLSLILATLVFNIDKKNKHIVELTHKIKAMNETLNKTQEQLESVKNQAKETIVRTRKYANSPKVPVTSFDNERTNNSMRDNPLAEIQRTLQVKTPEELVQVVKKMKRILCALPEMEHFIKEVTGMVCKDAYVKQPDKVIPTLKHWIKEKEKMLVLKNKISKLLYGDTTRSDSEIVLYNTNKHR
eukprot:TRINITY_DN4172_c0_g3_i1.p1 TRINITY_DN4172_c0_g3~~TRINITY_DN4172_c0_g3_i1.p1  ORF type:complete len:314 (-),score=60.34 TRINITY_DN4172_c0_g3_i1:132-1073(-)